MFGLDLLGLAHPKFSAQKAIQATPQGFAIGVFDSTFGDVLRSLRIMLRTGKYPACRVHLWWSNQHVICPLNVVKSRAPLYQKLAQEFPGVKFYLSHSCEYNERSLQNVKKRVALLRALAPSCIPVNSVWKGPTTHDAITEHHGSKTRAKSGEIVSTDGESAYDLDVKKWIAANQKASIIFLWGLRFNLREIPDPGQTPPPPKQRQAAPSLEYIKSVAELFCEPGNPPTPQFHSNFKPLKKPLLWKTHAEDSQGISDPRENMPIAILPFAAPYVDMVDATGDNLGRLIHGGTGPVAKTHRYYAGMKGGSNKYGYQIGRWIWLCDPTHSIAFGPVHATFRAGYFRAD